MGKIASLAQLRILILFVSTCCLTLIVANIITLNLTIICMLHPDYLGTSDSDSDETCSNQRISNDTIIDDQMEGTNPNGPIDIMILNTGLEQPRTCPDETEHPMDGFQWPKTVQNTLFSAFAWGALLGTLPVSYLLQRFETRRVFTVIGILSSIATIASPAAANQGYPYLIVCRVILGVSYAAFMPTMGAVTAQWAPLSENGLFMGFLGSSTQLSPVVAMPISGALCTSRLGWPAVFYVQGALTGAFFLLWALLYRDCPARHSLISKQELMKIEAGKSQGQKDRKAGPIPWKSILTSISILAILITSLGNFIGINAVIIYTPLYLRTILDFDIKSIGLLATLPTLFQFILKVFGGIASDYVPWGETLKVRLFNGVALYGMGIFLIILAFIPAEAKETALTVLICATAILGLHSGGFFKSATLVSRRYAPLIMGIIQLLDCFVWLTVPYAVGGITVNNTMGEWRIVWLGCAAILFVTSTVFSCLGSGEPAKWALPPRKLFFRRNTVVPTQNRH